MASRRRRAKGEKAPHGGASSKDQPGMLPTLSPKKAAQVFRASTPPANSSGFVQASKLGKRNMSVMFSYNALGHDFSDLDMKSDMTAALRQELLKKKAAKKRGDRKQKGAKSKRDGARGVSSSASTAAEESDVLPSLSSDSGAAASKRTKTETVTEAKEEDVVERDDDGDDDVSPLELTESASEGGQALERRPTTLSDLAHRLEKRLDPPTMETVVEGDTEEKVQEGEEVVDTLDRKSTLELGAFKSLEAPDATRSRSPSMAVKRTPTTKSFKLNFQIDFTKVNFKRLHEEKQRKLNAGGDEPVADFVAEGDGTGLIAKLSQANIVVKRQSMEKLETSPLAKVVHGVSDNAEDEGHDSDSYGEDSFEDYSDDFSDLDDD